MAKLRTTLLSKYIEEEVETDGLTFSENSITIPSSVYYLRQDRLSVPKDVSHESSNVFRQFKNIRIQLKIKGTAQSEIFQNYNQEGLFIHFLPSTEYHNQSIHELGEYLSLRLFIDYFNQTNVISTATSATYYKNIENFSTSHLSRFINSFAKENLNIDNIQDFELNWDKESGLKLQWISLPSNISLSKSNVRKEIAILQPKRLGTDIELAGIRSVISSEEFIPPTKTLIYVKPRHQSINETIKFNLETPVGLHPTLQLSNIQSPPLSEDNCKLFWISTVTNRLIFDKYQIDTNKFKLLSSWGDTDLEAPVWKVSNWGSLQILEVLDKENLKMTYHSRYIQPTINSETELLNPSLFYACDSEGLIEDHELITLNPFDTYGLGYDSFFDKDTVFYHFQNAEGISKFNIPTAEVTDYKKIHFITTAVVLLGTFYLLFKMFKAKFSKNSTDSESSKKNA